MEALFRPLPSSITAPPSLRVVGDAIQVNVTTFTPNIKLFQPCTFKEAREYKLHWQKKKDARTCTRQSFHTMCFTSSQSSISEESIIVSDESKGQQKELRGQTVMLEKGPQVDEHNTLRSSVEEENILSSSSEEDNFEFGKSVKMNKVCDQLIEIFLFEKPKADEWRKLLAFSKEWKNIRPHFFSRCKSRANLEEDPKSRGDLLKLARRLKEVDEDMERHNGLLADIEGHLLEIDTVVARRREDFTTDFFKHLQLLREASYNDLERQTELEGIASKCFSAVDTYDRAIDDSEALQGAQLKLDDILKSPSLEEACNKIDNMAKNQQLDSSFMLLLSKAWAGAKESNMMKDEVKDILYHLYMVAVGNMQRFVPKEVRIIRHVLSLEDPHEQMQSLVQAFSPGNELEGNDIDYLYTEPKKVYEWVKIILDAYYLKSQRNLMESVKQLMNPLTIQRLENLKGLLEREFL